MGEKMRAALFYGDKEDMRIEQIDVPKIGDGDILLKVRTCGICGSDARYYINGNEKRYKKPVILGHELVADIYKVGNKVKNYKPGERVTVAPIYGCGQCELCLSGHENLCKNVVVFGCTFDGGFAEYIYIPKKGVERRVLVKLDDSVSDKAGTMIEPFSCVLHGLRRLNIQPGDSLVIFGSGPIGLAHMITSKKIGTGKVAIIDIMESRLKEAIDFGADVTINGSSDDWKEKIFDYFGSNGVDHIVTAAPSLTAIENSIKIVKNGGSILVFGGLPHGNILKVDPNILHYNEITITGSIDSTIDDFKRTASMAPFLDLERFITHSFTLDNVKAGMDVMKKKEGLKVILDITKNN